MFSLLCVAMILINTLRLSLFDIYVEIISRGDSIQSVRRDRGHSPVHVHSEYCGHSPVPFAAAIAHSESASSTGVADHVSVVVASEAADVSVAAAVAVPHVTDVIAAPEAAVADHVVVAVPAAIAGLEAAIWT